MTKHREQDGTTASMGCRRCGEPSRHWMDLDVWLCLSCRDQIDAE